MISLVCDNTGYTIAGTPANQIKLYGFGSYTFGFGFTSIARKLEPLRVLYPLNHRTRVKKGFSSSKYVISKPVRVIKEEKSGATV